jgi:hypothetical protein
VLVGVGCQAGVAKGVMIRLKVLWDRVAGVRLDGRSVMGVTRVSWGAKGCQECCGKGGGV